MREGDIWNLYRKSNPCASAYQAWAFCGGGPLADKLADLVVRGIKTATSSAHPLYVIEGEPLPSRGDLCVILRDDGEAACIIRITDVRVCHFWEVDDEHAFREGEGDRSLRYWRQVHQEFFAAELAEHGIPFGEDMMVVCETFRVEFLPESASSRP